VPPVNRRNIIIGLELKRLALSKTLQQSLQRFAG
jgi:hypothetical protein